MTKNQFKGYILEEVLAYLIRTTGYELIAKAPVNDPDLKNCSNGLNVKGRGAKHQIDVLGELKWIPAFNFPLRLMIEAKCHQKKTGIEVIRNSVGILSDVNENYFTANDKNIKLRYHYTSAVFSTSGFSTPAIDMAIAHQIALIDLSDNIYFSLKNKIDEFTSQIFSNSAEINKEQARAIKTNLRKSFNDTRRDTIDIDEVNRSTTNGLIEFVKRDYGQLFVGMSLGGFMLLLKADDYNSFINYAKQKPTHNVKIHWSSSDDGKVWTIKPLHNILNINPYTLKFKLPEKLHDWIYKTDENKFKEAISAKEKYFSRISVCYNDQLDDKDYIFNLKFKKENIIGNNN